MTTGPAIHQLYCTHCTYGTSYLHQRDGAVRDQAFEYSVRVGSVKREECHDYFRRLESCMYYRLPGDTPHEQFLQLKAATAPQRLIYHPSIAGMRLVAQVSYRATDTQNRPGSYFAHVLFTETDNTAGNGARRGAPSGAPAVRPNWSAADAAQLWDCRDWKCEDADIPSELPTLTGLPELRCDNAPLIHDGLLLAFLTALGDEIYDPGQIIPARWRQTPPRERRELLVDILQSYLELDVARRQSVLIAVEPSVAALLFYGVARLLPGSGLGEQLSFSTFESHAVRPTTALAATTFRDPPRGELPREAYQNRGFAINTFRTETAPLPWKSRTPAPEYARNMVDLLIDRSWDAVHEALARFEKNGALTRDDLEGMSRAERLIQAATSPGAARADLALPQSEKAQQYVRAGVTERLLALAETPAFGPFANDPANVAVVLPLISPELATSAAGGNLLQRLLHSLSEEQLVELLLGGQLPDALKSVALAQFVRDRQRMPRGVETLWGVPRPAGRGQPTLLEGTLQALSPQELQALVLNLKKATAGTAEDEKIERAWADALVAVCDREPEKCPALGEFLDRVVSSERVARLLRTSATLRAAVLRLYPKKGKKLPALLVRLLKGLPEDAAFEATLVLLDDATRAGLLSAERPQVQAWQSCRSHLALLAEHFLAELTWQERLFGTRVRDATLNDDARNMADAAQRALPAADFSDDQADDRGDQLKRLAAQLHPQASFPETLWRKLEKYLIDERWTRVKFGRGTPLVNPVTLTVAVAVILLMAVGIGFAVSRFSTPEPAVAKPKRKPATAKPAAVNPSAENATAESTTTDKTTTVSPAGGDTVGQQPDPAPVAVNPAQKAPSGPRKFDPGKVLVHAARVKTKSAADPIPAATPAPATTSLAVPQARIDPDEALRNLSYWDLGPALAAESTAKLAWSSAPPARLTMHGIEMLRGVSSPALRFDLQCENLDPRSLQITVAKQPGRAVQMGRVVLCGITVGEGELTAQFAKWKDDATADMAAALRESLKACVLELRRSDGESQFLALQARPTRSVEPLEFTEGVAKLPDSPVGEIPSADLVLGPGKLTWQDDAAGAAITNFGALGQYYRESPVPQDVTGGPLEKVSLAIAENAVSMDSVPSIKKLRGGPASVSAEQIADAKKWESWIKQLKDEAVESQIQDGNAEPLQRRHAIYEQVCRELKMTPENMPELSKTRPDKVYLAYRNVLRQLPKSPKVLEKLRIAKETLGKEEDWRKHQAEIDQIDPAKKQGLRLSAGTVYRVVEGQFIDGCLTRGIIVPVLTIQEK